MSHTIVGSKSGKEVVSTERRVEWIRRASHLDLVGRGQFDDLAGTAMSSDNEILVADKFNH